MSRRQLVGVFEREEDVLAATRVSRERGYRIVDVHTPYAVHGLDRAMGLRPSRLPWAALLLGLIGASFKVWFEFWTTAVDWPINVGGKPFNSLPAFVPVTFEVMVLFAGVGTVLTFLIVRRLSPGRLARIPHSEVTSDKFVILLEESDAAFDADAVRDLFTRLGAVEVTERIAGREAEFPAVSLKSGARLNIALALGLVTTAALNWAVEVDHRRPRRQFAPDMVRSIPFDGYDANPYFRDGKTMQPPPVGTIRSGFGGVPSPPLTPPLLSRGGIKGRMTAERGEVPLHYAADSAGAVLAGEELANPYTLDSAEVRMQGAYVYRDYCLPCHGPQGAGDGIVVARGYPPPPSLMLENALNMKDGRMFHAITYGQGNMPAYAAQLSPDDRWKAVLHIRELQQQAPSAWRSVDTTKAQRTGSEKDEG